MPYSAGSASEPCILCGSDANIRREMFGPFVDCSRCGDFQMERAVADDLTHPSDAKEAALRSFIVRKMQGQVKRPNLTRDFLASLRDQTLPTPAEASDNLLIWIAEAANGRTGAEIEVPESDSALLGKIGAITPIDIRWMVDSMRKRGLLTANFQKNSWCILTLEGWLRLEELKRARISDRYAFFARKFSNEELDDVYDKCLRPAVAAAGYELRTVTQKAGLIDAVIEDEIRRCRFLIVDLSDGNAGAYWEAGLAEGLGKPVFYVCKEGTRVHFDTDHRHTVKWNVKTLDQTAVRLTAAIRNTLLGDDKQA